MLVHAYVRVLYGLSLEVIEGGLRLVDLVSFLNVHFDPVLLLLRCNSQLMLRFLGEEVFIAS